MMSTLLGTLLRQGGRFSAGIDSAMSNSHGSWHQSADSTRLSFIGRALVDFKRKVLSLYLETTGNAMLGKPPHEHPGRHSRRRTALVLRPFRRAGGAERQQGQLEGAAPLAS